MRVLLDESVPRQLALLLDGHTVTTVPQKGWAGLSNGELLGLAAQSFDAFVTADHSLQHQQNLAGVDLAVLVLVTPNNRVETITALSDRILQALAKARPGRVERVSA